MSEFIHCLLRKNTTQTLWLNGSQKGDKRHKYGTNPIKQLPEWKESSVEGALFNKSTEQPSKPLWHSTIHNYTDWFIGIPILETALVEIPI